MTLDEAMIKAAKLLDEQIAVWRAEMLCRTSEPTEEELENFKRFRDSEWEQWRTEHLAALRSWLKRDGEPLH
jgi:hypothetical protein